MACRGLKGASETGPIVARSKRVAMGPFSIGAMSVFKTERFWSKVAIGDGCWLWLRARFDDGYGAFRFDNRQYRAHRFAWLETRGSLPSDMLVLHHCDTPLCVRPDHLFLGTPADNMADRDRKGRQARGERHGSRTHPERVPRGERHGSRSHPERVPHGSSHPSAKLSEDGVRFLRALFEEGHSKKQLAKTFGITRWAVTMVVERRTWRSVA